MKRFYSFLFLFIFLITANLIHAQVPIRFNWSNAMSILPNGDMCVEVGNAQQLNINCYVYVAKNDIDLYPAMRIKYKIMTPTQQMESITAQLTKDKFLPYISDDGIALYRAALPMDYDCMKDCSMVGASNDHFDFTIHYNLVKATSDNTYEPYPYHMYAALWPDELFDLPSPDMEYYTEEKHICCLKSQDGLMADEGSYKIMYGQNNDAADSRNKQQNYNNLTATPNPFSNDITISYNALKSSTSNITCYDFQGRMVKTINMTATHDGVESYSMNLSECESGIYFVRLANGHDVSVIKVVKM